MVDLQPEHVVRLVERLDRSSQLKKDACCQRILMEGVLMFVTIRKMNSCKVEDDGLRNCNHKESYCVRKVSFHFQTNIDSQRIAHLVGLYSWENLSAPQPLNKNEWWSIKLISCWMCLLQKRNGLEPNEWSRASLELESSPNS